MILCVVFLKWWTTEIGVVRGVTVILNQGQVSDSSFTLPCDGGKRRIACSIYLASARLLPGVFNIQSILSWDGGVDNTDHRGAASVGQCSRNRNSKLPDQQNGHHVLPPE